MRAFSLPWTLLLLSGFILGGPAACGKKDAPQSVTPEVAPILPAPSSRTWSIGSKDPSDPVVAAVVAQGLPWSESLSGAGTILVLDHDGPYTLYEARWAAVRSGYPHRVDALVMGDVPAGSFPEDLPGALSSKLREGDHIGLVRARVGDGDRWLALLSRPEIKLSSFPKEVALDQSLTLPALPDLRWRLVGPDGSLSEGFRPMTPALQEEGEWWLELWTGPKLAVALPIYVGMSTPLAPLVSLPGGLSTDTKGALAELRRLVALVREDFEAPPVGLDPSLVTLARKPLDAVIAGTWDPSEGEGRLKAAGFTGGARQLSCQGETVALCLDEWLSSASERAALIDPSFTVMGAAAQVDPGGLSLVLNLGVE